MIDDDLVKLASEAGETAMRLAREVSEVRQQVEPGSFVRRVARLTSTHEDRPELLVIMTTGYDAQVLEETREALRTPEPALTAEEVRGLRALLQRARALHELPCPHVNAGDLEPSAPEPEVNPGNARVDGA